MIPIYIGISKRFDCIKGMTERSILENTRAEVDIIHLYPAIEAGCTGFSNVRYTIRKGIYLDCDMVILGDIAELWSFHKEGKFVCMQDGSTEVAVIDCEHNCTNKTEQHLLPKDCSIPLEWNVEDFKYHNTSLPENIKNFHFTDMKTQPWFFSHPNREALEIYGRYR